MSSKINLQTCEYARKSSIFQDNQLIYTKNISKQSLENKLKNSLLVFDDLERIPPNMLDNFLGYISSKYISNGFHVLLITDESNIKDQGKYWEYKEKYIRYTIPFSLSILDQCKKIIDKRYRQTPIEDLIEKDSKIIEKCFDVFNDRNLRTWMYAFDTYNTSLSSVQVSIKTSKLFFTIFSLCTFTRKTGSKNIADFINFLKIHKIASSYSLYGELFFNKFSPGKEYYITSTQIEKFVLTGCYDEVLLKQDIESIFAIQDTYIEALSELENNIENLSYSKAELMYKKVYEGLLKDKYSLNDYNNILYRLHNPCIMELLQLSETDFDHIVDKLLEFSSKNGILKDKEKFELTNPNINQIKANSIGTPKWNEKLLTGIIRIFKEEEIKENKKKNNESFQLLDKQPYHFWKNTISDKKNFIRYLAEDADISKILQMNIQAFSNLILLIYDLYDKEMNNDQHHDELYLLNKRIEQALVGFEYKNLIHKMMIINLKDSISIHIKEYADN